MVGLFDPILNDPLDKSSVQIPGDHGLDLRPFRLRPCLRRRSGVGRAKSELHLQLAFDGHDSRDVDAQRQLEVKARRYDVTEPPKAQHHALGLGRHRIEAGPGEDEQSEQRLVVIQRNEKLKASWRRKVDTAMVWMVRSLVDRDADAKGLARRWPQSQPLRV